MGERHWPGCTYRGEFGTNGLPCGKGGVVTFNGIVVKEGVFEQGCLARPLREQEFTNGANGANGANGVARVRKAMCFTRWPWVAGC